jgi:cell shape-determining protein MreC
MSTLRFKHVYFVLMLGAFICAFLLPQTFTDSARLGASGIFNPLSAPMRRIALAVDHRVAPEQEAEVTDARALAKENDQLRQEVVRLQSTVDELQAIDGERQKLGDLKSLCVHANVAGGDSGGRDALILSLPSSAKVANDDPVLFSGGLAGRLESSHGGARVRLITDKGFTVTGSFIRYAADSRQSGTNVVYTRLMAPTAVVRGMGGSKLIVDGMKWSDCKDAGLAPGDWIILDDPRWPQARGLCVARISSVGPQAAAPLFADIELSTGVELTNLADVWILAGT